jgi:WD40-like Beta Propeller Repeat
MRSIKGRVWLAAVAVALIVPASAQATFPGANGKIAFVRDYDEIWTMNPDGSNQVDITNTPTADEDSPAWSADGKRITYVVRTNQPFLNSSEIWVMNADGTGQTRIVPAPTDPNMCSFDQTVVSSGLGSPHWSPDGSKIVYHHARSCRFDGDTESPESDLYIVNADGSGQTLLKALSAAGPVWSPDGTKIGHSSGCYTAPCDSTSWITPDGSQDFSVHFTNGEEYFIDWHPWMSLMDSFGERPTGFYSFTIHPDGSGYSEFPSSDTAGRWSPDGTKFLYGGVDVANSDGSGRTRVATGTNPDWQPVTTNYARPRGATPSEIFLVPAYGQCIPPGNRTHGSPLAFPSCAPPTQTSSQLTMGTPDANGAPAKGFAKVVYTAGPGDFAITTTITDVRNKSDLSDYTGGLQEAVLVRITDHYNGPSLTEPATMQDIPFPNNVPCSVTADTTVGSTCSNSTTANAIVPGSFRAHQRTIIQLGRVRVFDGGSSGTPGAGDSTLFLDEGIFVP